jgi:8-oxo-dGTP diphosphatase
MPTERSVNQPQSRRVIVAAVIITDGRVLACERSAPPEVAGRWEFPGGKVEPGEAPVDALVRELREEIGVTVSVGRIWEVLFHAYPEFDLVMLVYVCRIIAGSGAASQPDLPRAVEVADLAWVAAHDLAGWDILPADRPLVDRLRAEGVPPN